MYNYIFYRLYKYAKKTEKKWGSSLAMPITLSIYSLIMLQYLNLLTVFALLTHYIKIIPSFTLTKTMAIGTGLIMYIINYLVFIRNKKFLQIEKKFDRDSDNVKVIKTILFWLYVILSFVLFIVVLETFKTVQR